MNRELIKYEKLLNKTLTENRFGCNEIVQNLNKVFAKTIIFFQLARNAENRGRVIVNANYTPKIYPFMEHVMITLIFPKGKRVMDLDDEEFRFLKLQILKTLAHELQHKKQHKKRRGLQKPVKKHQSIIGLSKKVNTMISYLSEDDEIDAYSYETHLDIKNGLITTQHLKQPENVTIGMSESIYLYNKFIRYVDRKNWKKFMKKVYKYAQL